VSANVLPLESGSSVTSEGSFDGSATVVALPIGLRCTPAMGDLRTQWAKPFLAIGVGPVVGSLSGSGSTAASTSAPAAAGCSAEDLRPTGDARASRRAPVCMTASGVSGENNTPLEPTR
jgi:hypothetical protein